MESNDYHVKGHKRGSSVLPVRLEATTAVFDYRNSLPIIVSLSKGYDIKLQYC